jgi:hypothetical protein
LHVIKNNVDELFGDSEVAITSIEHGRFKQETSCLMFKNINTSNEIKRELSGKIILFAEVFN